MPSLKPGSPERRLWASPSETHDPRREPSWAESALSGARTGRSGIGAIGVIGHAAAQRLLATFSRRRRNTSDFILQRLSRRMGSSGDFSGPLRWRRGAVVLLGQLI